MGVNAGKGHQLPWQVAQCLSKKVTFANDDQVVSLGWLPANSAVIASGVSIQTAWNGDGNDTVDLGFRASEQGATTDDDAFSETIFALDALGHVQGDVVSTANLFFSAPVEVTATLASAGTAPTAGVAYVYVTFICFGNQETL